MTEFIGYLAAFITTACYIPQAWHILKTRQTAGISLLAYSMLITGVMLWLCYGILIGSMPVILANLVTFVLLGAILFMKWKFRS